METDLKYCIDYIFYLASFRAKKRTMTQKGIYTGLFWKLVPILVGENTEIVNSFNAQYMSTIFFQEMVWRIPAFDESY